MAWNTQFFAGTAAAALAAGLAAGAASAQDAPIVQPGAPGENTRALTAEEAVQIAANRYSQADVRFMQGMILHHFQAVQMAALVDERTNTEPLIDIASRIDTTQPDEIAFMRR